MQPKTSEQLEGGSNEIEEDEIEKSATNLFALNAGSPEPVEPETGNEL